MAQRKTFNIHARLAAVKGSHLGLSKDEAEAIIRRAILFIAATAELAQTSEAMRTRLFSIHAETEPVCLFLMKYIKKNYPAPCPEAALLEKPCIEYRAIMVAAVKRMEEIDAAEKAVEKSRELPTKLNALASRANKHERVFCLKK